MSSRSKPAWAWATTSKPKSIGWGDISLAPKKFVDRRIAEGLDDTKHGRVRGPFDTVDAMLQSLKGKKPTGRAGKH